MPKLTETPKHLRPFEFLGLDISYKQGDKEGIADCLFCSREGKLNINVESGKYRCVVCEEAGNIYVFMRKLHSMSFEATATADYKELAADRKLYTDETLIHWQLAKNLLTGSWLVPGYNIEGKLTGLYEYRSNAERMMLMPTPGLGHHLLGMNLWDKQKTVAYICEGVWDGTSLWETLQLAKPSSETLVATSNPSASLLADANVIAIPGNLVFYEPWCELLGGKVINLMAQNDHPHTHPKTGKHIESASYYGMNRIAKMLQAADHPPEQINMLHWGDGGFNPELKSGHDIRDCITT